MNKILNIFGSLLIIFSTLSCKPNKIGLVKIEHIGSCDKYISTLIFVKSDTTANIETEKLVKVSTKTFDLLTDYLLKNKTNTEFDNYINKYGDYGTFRINIITKDNLKDTIKVHERKNSYIFFSHLNQYLIENKIDSKITDMIQEYILKRIDHPASGFPEN